MHRTIRSILAALLLAAVTGGCRSLDPITGPPPQSGSANFSNYVGLGTNLCAGTESGGTVERHQAFSYSTLFSQQIGSTNYDRQSYDQDGIDLLNLAPGYKLQSLSPLIISTAGQVRGSPTRSAQPTDFHNLGVPGAIVSDVVDSSAYYGGANYHSAHFDFIARHRGLLAQQVARLQPTFVTFEYGANELLGPATRGSGNPIFPPGLYGIYLHAALDAVQAAAPTAKLALFTVPDATDIPYSRTFSWITRDSVGLPTPLLGPGGAPLAPGSLVLLSAGDSLAAGTGFLPSCRSYVSGVHGNGRPLRDDQILTPAEVASLQSAVLAYNTSISSEATARGTALVDLYAVIKSAAANGITYNGTRYTTAFVTGGLFSLDGVHPTDFGYGVMANALIDAVNAKFGSTVLRVDLSRCQTASSSSLIATAPRGGTMPWILHGEQAIARMFPLGGDSPR